jgi:hypothetical protein
MNALLHEQKVAKNPHHHAAQNPASAPAASVTRPAPIPRGGTPAQFEIFDIGKKL